MQTGRAIIERLLACAAPLALAAAVQAAPVALDPDFDGDGTHVVGGAYWPVGAVEIDDEQRIVVVAINGAGGTALLRFLPDGSLDPGFGSQGIATDDFLTPEAHGLAIRSNGSLLVAGRRLSSFLVSAWAESGTLDTGFGTNGHATLRVNGFSQDEAWAVAVQSTGRIVIAGQSEWSAQTHVDFAVAGFESDGDLDTGFGTNGRTLTDFDLSSDYGAALALQDDDALVVAGNSTSEGLPSTFALARYTDAGELDAGFGTGGLVRTEFPGGNAEAFTVSLQSDGFIVAGGRVFPDDCGLARYEPDGDLDPDFGDGGRVTTDLGTNGVGNVGCEIRDLAIDGEGRIVAVGRTVPAGDDDDFVLLRYLPDGTLDASFAGGVVTTDVTGLAVNDEAKAVAIDGEGRIVAAGETTADSTFTTAVARYRVPEPEGSLATLAALVAAIGARRSARSAGARRSRCPCRRRR